MNDVCDVLAEVTSGGGLSLTSAAKLFPSHRGSGTANPATVFRWVTIGAKSPTGTLVRLEAVRVGSKWLTSRPAIERFVAQLTVGSIPNASTHQQQPNNAHKRATQASDKLRELGA